MGPDYGKLSSEASSRVGTQCPPYVFDRSRRVGGTAEGCVPTRNLIPRSRRVGGTAEDCVPTPNLIP